MFSRLTRSARIKLGWLIASVYLACVLAPGAALALGTGPAPCLADLLPPIAVSSAHDDPASMMHLHDHGSTHMHHQARAENLSENLPAKNLSPKHTHPANHTHDGKTAPGSCCAMLCVSALPAELPTIPKPSPPVSIARSEAHHSIPGKAPPLPYRPPIA